jgi:hypothetical protein
VSRLLGSALVVGFSGSRSVVPERAVRSAVAVLPPGCRVLVGCAAGVDGFVRSLVPGAEVFAVSSGRWGRGRGAFAGRSAAVVRAVAAAGGVWVSFPSGACPVGLVPSSSQSSCFGGFGSGSWASAAFAAGLGVPVLLWLPPGVPVPGGWGFVAGGAGGGWFLLVPPVQLSLV